jgi:hypothetical protein
MPNDSVVQLTLTWHRITTSHAVLTKLKGGLDGTACTQPAAPRLSMARTRRSQWAHKAAFYCHYSDKA